MHKQRPLGHILIAGLGDIGGGLATRLVQAGHRVSGIRRQHRHLEGVDLYSQDLAQDALVLPPDRIDVVVIVMTPDERNEAGYQRSYLTAPLRLLDAIAASQPMPAIIFVSSTAVFGELQGRVDEQTPPRPEKFNGRILLAAEEEISLRGLATCVRFAGIYGPGRQQSVRKARQLAAGELPLPEASWTNRIHRDDCIGLLATLVESWLSAGVAPSLVVGCDNQPVSSLVLYQWLAEQQGLALALPVSAEVSGKQLYSGFIGEGHYSLRYPDYRAGYQALFTDSVSRSP